MMTVQKQFKQGALIAPDSLGICMRVTFKWLALKVARGEFKYEKINVSKTEKKMASYGDPFIQRLCDKNFSALEPTQSQKYLNDDVQSIKSYAALWGQRIVDKNKNTFTGITAQDGLAVTSLHDYVNSTKIEWSKFHAIYSFYMQLPASVLENILGSTGKKLSTGVHAKVEDTKRTIMAGHVVGISGSDNTFFDANSGMYVFDSSDPQMIVNDIESHVKKEYKPETSYKRGIVLIGTWRIDESVSIKVVGSGPNDPLVFDYDIRSAGKPDEIISGKTDAQGYATAQWMIDGEIRFRGFGAFGRVETQWRKILISRCMTLQFGRYRFICERL